MVAVRLPCNIDPTLPTPFTKPVAVPMAGCALCFSQRSLHAAPPSTESGPATASPTRNISTMFGSNPNPPACAYAAASAPVAADIMPTTSSRRPPKYLSDNTPQAIEPSTPPTSNSDDMNAACEGGYPPCLVRKYGSHIIMVYRTSLMQKYATPKFISPGISSTCPSVILSVPCPLSLLLLLVLVLDGPVGGLAVEASESAGATDDLGLSGDGWLLPPVTSAGLSFIKAKMAKPQRPTQAAGRVKALRHPNVVNAKPAMLLDRTPPIC
mmetsp:Transcript_47878/g.119770  ORF Transcript_47878/g.119770 Transcript_47878/m.119770 type:complete len:268 (+) Transcript_47878:494-1297(+)